MNRDADARTGEYLVPVQGKRPGQAIERLLRSAGDVLYLIGTLQHQDELVPTQPRDRVLGAHAGLEPPRHCLEQLVAHLMAEAVVDGLEIVDVQEQQGRRQAVAARAAEDAGQAVAEQVAVGQAGQRIIVRQTVQALLGFHALGHVLAGGYEVGDLALVVFEGRDGLFLVI